MCSYDHYTYVQLSTSPIPPPREVGGPQHLRLECARVIEKLAPEDLAHVNADDAEVLDFASSRRPPDPLEDTGALGPHPEPPAAVPADHVEPTGPTEPSPKASSVSVSSLLEQLNRRVLGTSIVHQEALLATPAQLVHDVSHLGPQVERILRAARIPALYSHQEEAIRLIQQGRDVVVATPTASGKTLIYNAAVLSSMLQDPCGCALYVFPLKALEQDQLDELRTLLERLHCGLRAEIYDGDTKAGQREKIRHDLPNILITTPDMLHSGILAFHEMWEELFRHLEFVVIDELHTYSGIFGSHILHVFRRLNRICAACGSNPTYIASSATIGNPEELAGKLVNRTFHAITESGAPTAPRHFIFLNPGESPNTVAARLLQLSVTQDFRTIVFTRARVITELIYRWATQTRPHLRDRISAYRAGYLPEERRQIEASLFSGDLLGVVSTSALELGIDIGGLDVCILVGYPGSIVNTWQRAGRVGRSGRESLVFLVASRDALDQFFMKHPTHFFGRDIENAVADPSNRHILKSHLVCAARELPLTAWEPEYDMEGWREAVEDLTRDGDLLQSADGDAWFASRKHPHRLLSMRSIGESWSIYRHGTKQVIGTVSGAQVYTECYEGAVYLHRGRQYLIGERDPVKRRIEAEEVDLDYYTRPQQDKETEVIEELRARPLYGYMARLARLLVSSQVIAYERVRVGDQAILGREPLESPVQQFETVGLWLEMDASFEKELKRHGFHHMGSIHAIEHVMKSLFPLLALSKGTDLGGICYPMHPQLRKGAIFIYDQYPGGIGLAEKGFDMLERLLELSLEMVSHCPCDKGCPSCIHSPSCGNGNKPLDKPGAIHLLELLTGRRDLDPNSLEINGIDDQPPIFADWETNQEKEEDPVLEPEEPRVVVFDLETQRSAAEVGGWDKAHLMRMSCGIVWDSREDHFFTYFENQVEGLIEHLKRSDLVVGFNVIGFDYSVLRGYTDFDFRALNTLDMLREVKSHLNYRVSLNALASATLNAPKSANGLQALQWWKDGRLDLIEQYCRDDVKLTRDLFQHGVDKGYLVFDRRGEGRMRVPVVWDVGELAGAAAAEGR